MNKQTDIMETVKKAVLTDYNPITIEIIQSSLRAITDEMFATMRKTAVSSIIYEVLDFGVAMFDAKGNLASSGSGIPGFIGMLEPGVRKIMEKFPANQIFEGDIFMSNIPHFGGVSHLNDIVLIMPVFHEDILVGWLSNKAHWTDVGGAFPGSISPDAVDIYQEGLQIPSVRVIDKGQINQALLDVITQNSRVPDTTRGDFWAGVAAMRAGEKRLKSTVKKYGRETVEYAISNFIDLGEKQSLRALKDLPKGEFHASEILEDGQTFKVIVTITDTDFIVDLRDNPPQNKNAMNCSYEATFVDAMMVFKAIAAPQGIANCGTFKPIQVLTDKGSFVDAEYPCAMSVYYEVAMLTFDLIWKALAPQMPDKLTAGHYSSICGTFIGGPHPDTNIAQAIVEPQLGGWGASQDSDGINALYTGYHGDTYNCPVEITEQKNGLMVDRLALTDEQGGEGEFIGGKGINLDYRILRDEWWLTMAYVRSETGPWGMAGGKEGTTNFVRVARTDGTEERYTSCTALPLKKDDVIKVFTATGGGYGDPKNRSRDQVLSDIKNGYITADRAKEIYGVSL